MSSAQYRGVYFCAIPRFRCLQPHNPSTHSARDTCVANMYYAGIGGYNILMWSTPEL